MIPELKESQVGARNYTGALEKLDGDEVDSLLKSLSCQSLSWLAWNQSKMEKYKVSLNHVHPLDFLQHSLLDPKKCQHLVELSKRSAVIWTPFADGIKKKLNEEDKKLNVTPHLTQFAEAIGLDKPTVDYLISNRRISELVNMAIEIQKSDSIISV